MPSASISSPDTVHTTTLRMKSIRSSSSGSTRSGNLYVERGRRKEREKEGVQVKWEGSAYALCVSRKHHLHLHLVFSVGLMCTRIVLLHHHNHTYVSLLSYITFDGDQLHPEPPSPWQQPALPTIFESLHPNTNSSCLCGASTVCSRATPELRTASPPHCSRACPR